MISATAAGPWGLALAAGLGLAGCSNNDPFSLGNGAGRGCARCGSSGGGSNGASTAGGQSSGGSPGGSTAGTSGGSAGGGASSAASGSGGQGLDCQRVSAPLDDGGCSPDQISFYGQALDLCRTVVAPNRAHVPLGGVTLGVDGCANTVSTDDAGFFSLCVPPNAAVSATYAKPGYASGDLAEVNSPSDLGFLTTRGGIYVACDLAIGSEQSKLSNYDSSRGAVLVNLLSYSNTYPCGRDDAGNGDLSGWRVLPLYLDGDAGPWPVAYLNESVAVVASGATEPPGYALVYNIDVPEITITVDRPGDDGGLVERQCQPLTSIYHLTGRVRAPPMGFSFAPIVLP